MDGYRCIALLHSKGIRHYFNYYIGNYSNVDGHRNEQEKGVIRMKKELLRAIARVGYNSAIKAAGTASKYGTYQPKEPVVLQSLRKSK